MALTSQKLQVKKSSTDCQFERPTGITKVDVRHFKLSLYPNITFLGYF